MRRLLSMVVLLGVALSGCSGTSTPLTPILYLVVETGTPARIALVSFTSNLDQRSIELVNANAFSFAADELPIAIDVRNRAEPSELWVLTASRLAPRATALHRFSLSNISDATGTTLSRSGAPTQLTAANGAWSAPFSSDSVFPSGCISDLVVAASGNELLLVDAGASGRCGSLGDDPGDRLVHHLSLTSSRVRERVREPLTPFARPGILGNEAILALRPTVGSSVNVQLTAMAPGSSPRLNLELDVVRDLRALSAGIAVLNDLDGGRRVELIPLNDEAERVNRGAVAGASRLYTRDEGGGISVLTHSNNRIGVDYPSRDQLREINFAALDVTIDPNAYAVVLGSNNLCFVDLLVASGSTACDFRLPSGTTLSNARFITWAYATPSAP